MVGGWEDSYQNCTCTGTGSVPVEALHHPAVATCYTDTPLHTVTHYYTLLHIIEQHYTHQYTPAHCCALLSATAQELQSDIAT